jgi:hypothetical protein
VCFFKKKLSNIARHHFVNLGEKEKEGQKHGKLRTYITFIVVKHQVWMTLVDN